MSLQEDSALYRALGTVHDPELGYSITDLGLVYGIEHTSDTTLLVTMTLTSPACPRPDFFKEAVVAALYRVAPHMRVEVLFTFTPTWTLARATEATRAELAAKGIPITRW